MAFDGIQCDVVDNTASKHSVQTYLYFSIFTVFSPRDGRFIDSFVVIIFYISRISGIDLRNLYMCQIFSCHIMFLIFFFIVLQQFFGLL